MAKSIFTNEPDTTGEELDLKKLFARILEKVDWTDKLAYRYASLSVQSSFSRIRANSFLRSNSSPVVSGSFVKILLAITLDCLFSSAPYSSVGGLKLYL